MLGNISGPLQPPGPPVLQPIAAAPVTLGAHGYALAPSHPAQAQLGPVLGPARPESAAAAEHQPKKLATAPVDQELTAFMPSALRARRTTGAPTNHPKRARVPPPTQLTTGRALFAESTATAPSQSAPPRMPGEEPAGKQQHQPLSSGSAGRSCGGGVPGGDAFAEFMAEMDTLDR